MDWPAAQSRLRLRSWDPTAVEDAVVSVFGNAAVVAAVRRRQVRTSIVSSSGGGVDLSAEGEVLEHGWVLNPVIF